MFTIRGQYGGNHRVWNDETEEYHQQYFGTNASQIKNISDFKSTRFQTGEEWTDVRMKRATIIANNYRVFILIIIVIYICVCFFFKSYRYRPLLMLTLFRKRVDVFDYWSMEATNHSGFTFGNKMISFFLWPWPWDFVCVAWLGGFQCVLIRLEKFYLHLFRCKYVYELIRNIYLC